MQKNLRAILSPGQDGLNPWTLQLSDPVEEKRFRIRDLPHGIRLIRRNLYIAIIILVAYIYPDYYYLGYSDNFFNTTIVRILLIIFLIVYLNRIKRFRNPIAFDRFILILSIIFSTGVCVLLYFLRNSPLTAYTPLLLILGYYIFLPVGYIYRIISGITGSLMFLYFYQYIIRNTPSGGSEILTAFLIANVLGISFTRETIRLKYREFLDHCREHEIRRNLEIEIKEKERLENTLRNLAETDSLTGDINRRKFMEIFEDELKRAFRYHRPLCLLILDVDHFKKINDSYGHMQGDRAIQHLSKVVSEELRSSDTFARIGGEEFAIILPETDTPSGVIVSEKLRKKVESSSMQTETPFTISLGIAGYERGMTIDDLYAKADIALYRAKKAGRNRTMNFEDSPPE